MIFANGRFRFCPLCWGRRLRRRRRCPSRADRRARTASWPPLWFEAKSLTKSSWVADAGSHACRSTGTGRRGCRRSCRCSRRRTGASWRSRVERNREEPLLAAAEHDRPDVEKRRAPNVAGFEHDDPSGLLDDVQPARLAGCRGGVDGRLEVCDADDSQGMRARRGRAARHEDEQQHECDHPGKHAPSLAARSDPVTKRRRRRSIAT